MVARRHDTFVDPPIGNEQTDYLLELSSSIGWDRLVVPLFHGESFVDYISAVAENCGVSGNET